MTFVLTNKNKSLSCAMDIFVFQPSATADVTAGTTNISGLMVGYTPYSAWIGNATANTDFCAVSSAGVVSGALASATSQVIVLAYKSHA